MIDSLIMARRYRHVVALLVVGGLSVVTGSTPMAAQEIDSHEPPNSVSQTARDRRSETNVSDPNEPSQDNAEHGGAFIVAPLPISSPAIGSGIVPVVAYIFSLGGKDQISAPSVVGGSA